MRPKARVGPAVSDSPAAEPPPKKVGGGGRWVPGALLALFVSLGLSAAHHDSVTVDEFAIVPSGYIKLTHPGQVNWLNPVNPPLIQYALALPWLVARPNVDPGWWATPQEELRWKVGDQFMHANMDRYDSLFFLSRLVGIAFGLLLVIYAWRWSAVLFGRVGGLVTLGLCCLCPTLIANSHLATVDIGATAFLLIASYYFWRLLQNEGPWNWKPSMAFAVSFALALSAKYTALLCVPVFVALAVAIPWQRRSWPLAKSLGLSAVVAVVITLVVLSALYGFDQIGSTASQAVYVSRTLRPIASGWLSNLPIPFPVWYIKGFDQEANRIELVRIVMYYMGQVTSEKHFSYFAVAILLKTPIPHVLLIAAGLRLAVVAAWRRPTSLSRLAIGALLLPPLWFLALFSFAIGSNLGIRYVLFPVVGLYIVGGAVGLWARTDRRRMAVVGALTLSAVSVFSQSPYFLSYFNEAAGGPDGGRRYLGDSNVDWGQDLKSLMDVLVRRRVNYVYLSYFGPVSPDVYGIRGTSLANRHGQPGLVAISVQHLLGIDAFDSGLPAFAAPYRNRTPIGSAGHSILLFEER